MQSKYIYYLSCSLNMQYISNWQCTQNVYSLGVDTTDWAECKMAASSSPSSSKSLWQECQLVCMEKRALAARYNSNKNSSLSWFSSLQLTFSNCIASVNDFTQKSNIIMLFKCHYHFLLGSFRTMTYNWSGFVPRTCNKTCRVSTLLFEVGV